MIDDLDLLNSTEVELLRRSVAMLAPGSDALNREETLRVLNVLAALLKADDEQRWVPGDPAG